MFFFFFTAVDHVLRNTSYVLYTSMYVDGVEYNSNNTVYDCSPALHFPTLRPPSYLVSTRDKIKYDALGLFLSGSCFSHENGRFLLRNVSFLNNPAWLLHASLSRLFCEVKFHVFVVQFKCSIQFTKRDGMTTFFFFCCETAERDRRRRISAPPLSRFVR